jgi:hypothetical protein
LAEPEKETEPTNQVQTQATESVKAIEQPTNLDQSETVQKFRAKYGTPNSKAPEQ